MAIFFGKGSQNRRRALVIGLDGVPFSLLQNLRKQGRIPVMNSLFETGCFGQMSVSIPEISSVSWSSFMTGKQSGEHGIYGFIDLEPGTYHMRFPNFASIKSPTLWEELARVHKKSVVVNMPATYPARDINGALISGFVAVDMNKSVQPVSLIPRLRKMGYRIDVDTTKGRRNHEFLFQDLNETLDGRERTADFLWKEIDWDLFIIVITGTDRLMHFLWDAYTDQTHNNHNDFLNYFDKVDGLVGRLYDKFLKINASAAGNPNFYMLSDHGFTKIETEVHINRWLQENGYLKFQNTSPRYITDIGPGSSAFALDPSRIYINLKKKYPLGIIEKSEYSRIREEIRSGLEQLTFAGGQPVVKHIFFKEEIYSGPCMDQAPDLVILSRPGYDLKAKVNVPGVFEKTDLQGMHTQDDAFFFSSAGAGCGSIFDAKKVIMDSLAPD